MKTLSSVTSVTRSVLGSSIAALVLLVAACGGEPASSTSHLTSASSAGVTTNDAAVMELTNARCDREVACNNVGLQRRFTDRDACARDIGRDVQRDLRANVCPRGVDVTKLSLCVAVARQERCGVLLDSIDRATSCRRAELCI